MSLSDAGLLDKRFGTPLPFGPKLDRPVRPQRGMNPLEQRLSDLHHPAGNKQLLIHGTIAQQAMRYCRTEWVCYDDHHAFCHEGAGVKMELPVVNEEQFSWVGMMAALYIPDQGLTFRRTGKQRTAVKLGITDISMAERQAMWERDDIQVDVPRKVSNFLVAFATEHSLNVMDEADSRLLMGQYLDDPERHIGTLSGHVTHIAAQTTGFGEMYSEARGSGMIPTSVAPTAEQFLMQYFEGDIAYTGWARLEAEQTFIQQQVGRTLTDACARRLYSDDYEQLEEAS